MILRRFTKHVTDQNWFAVGLDIIVVVVGIFLGLQVTEWNEMRKERDKESGYLIRMAEDVKSTLTNWETSERIYGNIYKKGLVAMSFLNGDKPSIDNIQLLATLYVSTQSHGGIYIIDDTYDELSSSGQLNLISNTVIRKDFRSLIEYIERGRSGNSIYNDNISYRNAIRSIIPIEMQMQIRRECSGRKSYLPCEINLDPILVKDSLQQILENPTIKLHLNIYMQSLVIEETRVKRSIARISELNERIQEELLRYDVINEP